MLGIYILYNKTTGIIIQTGTVNKERDVVWIANGDTTTAWGMIQKELQEHPELGLAISPKGCNLHKLSNESQKMNKAGDEIISKTSEELELDRKAELIAEKKAEISRLQILINAQNNLNALQKELASLEAA